MAGTQNIGETSDNPVAINVVAMVDVIFCLCIFFMCSFHFKQLEGKIESHLPKDRGLDSTPASSIVKDEIRVIMRWDPGSNATLRKVKGHEYAGSDEELIAAICGMRDNYEQEGKTDWPLTIDAEGDVPWEEVIHVMDLCKQNRIERIEFGAPEREIERQAPPA
ncbi:MAG TPA: biopolymer transporter ExbD [Planctomycetota bacterium]|jgi:biopolymer transport protein ExbD|nr:biopolymer transporter ExbD [Planctomycetota bacterium]OQC19083.1 MAG: Biopolymer transport protein ExbD/TolR [Planctomycetes bacterium ADurb.Bin069]HNS00528.1 biopolymer transporter ExbD [Planctomycetota bacterium]HNU27232.1 biopolymer transporter ExbD [Planctomycetota bacterium]HOE31145.1 biopolymer transporter ExbD [Planctomycetota bacterium]